MRHLLFAALLGPIAALAQTVPSGILAGTVSDSAGYRIPGAQIHIIASGAEFNRDIVCDAGGSFHIQLAAGRYSIQVSAPGFSPTLQTVRIAGNQTQSIAASLAVATNEETVTVNAQTTDLSAAGNASATVMGKQELAELSDDDATFQQQLLALASGDGEHPPQVYVDGFSGGQFPPKNAIRAVRINQNPYSAEYESIGFSRIEIDTKPGTGKLHGEIDSFGNDSAFNSDNPFLHTADPGYYTVRLNTQLSGPLDNKSSFFLSTVYNNSQSNSISDGTDANGPFSIATPSPSLTQDYNLRFDRQLSKNNTATLRYEFDRAAQSNAGLQLYNLPSTAYSNYSGAQTLQAGNSEIIGAHALQETRFQWQHTVASQNPVSTLPSVQVSGAFSGGGSSSGQSYSTTDQYQFEERATYDHKSQFLKAGFRFRLNHIGQDSRALFDGSYYFPNLAAYIASAPTQVELATGRTAFSASTADFAWYLEDEWKARKDLTFDFGFRAESQTAIPDHWDPSPHFGMAWALGARGTKPPIATIRFGGAIFYTRFDISNLLVLAQRGNTDEQQVYVNSFPTSPACNDFTQVPSAACLGSALATTPSTYRLAPGFRNSYDEVFGGSVEIPVGKQAGFTLNLNTEHGVHYGVTVDANAPRPDGTRPLGTAAGDPYVYLDEAFAKNFQFFINAHAHVTKRIHWWLFANRYRVRSDTFGITSQASNSYNLLQDYGRATWDRHYAVFTGVSADLPAKLEFDSFLVARGGQPFNITTGLDNNKDTAYNDRPSFAGPLSNPANVIHTQYGNFNLQPVPGERIIPINFGSPRGFLSLQISLHRDFQFGPPAPIDPDAPPTPAGKNPAKPAPRYTLSFGVECQNITNSVSPGIPDGVLTSPDFGQSLSTANAFALTAAANRTISLRTNFRF